MNIKKKRFKDLRGTKFFLRISSKNEVDSRLHKREPKCSAMRLTDSVKVEMNPGEFVIPVRLNFCSF